MSRMLAHLSGAPMSPAEALGEGLLAAFLDLATLHSDGWGHAWSTASDASPSVATGLDRVRSTSLGPSARIGMLYLRFASAGSAVAPENLQPFLADGLAFAHNGALVPRDLGERALTDRERAGLRGTTDSEVYFALLRRALTGTDAVESRVAAGVAVARSLYPTACLNAMLIFGDELVVVSSRGTVEPPLRTFAARGATALPPGHDASYNVLSTSVLSSGARVVATTGIDTTGWEPLENDTVQVFTPDGRVRCAPLP